MELRPTANDELGNSRHKFERHNYIRAMKGYGRHHVLHYTISVAHAHVQHRHHARARAHASHAQCISINPTVFHTLRIFRLRYLECGALP